MTTPARTGPFGVSGSCVRDGAGLLCTADAANPPGKWQLSDVRFQWFVDGAAQGSRTGLLRVATLSPGPHTVGVRAFTPDTILTDMFTIPVR